MTPRDNGATRAMGIKCGIVGLPNVGKSTLFNALTKAGIAAANFPFCTIEPNVGIVPVPDPRLNALSEIVKPQKCIPTAVEFVDIAGLVAGAAKRRGPGQQVPGPHPRGRCDHPRGALLRERRRHPRQQQGRPAGRHRDHRHRAGAGRPGVRRQGAEPAERSAKTGDKDARRRAPRCWPISAGLNEGKPARSLGLSDDDKAAVRDLFLLTLKPVMYVANVLEDGFENNPHLDAVRARAAGEGAEVVPVCAAIEEELSQLDDADRDDVPEGPRPGRARPESRDPRRLQAARPADLLHRRREGSARLDGQGRSTAPQAAGVIHTDFEKGFIRAETIGYDDFIKYRGEAGARDAGRLRLEGKEYRVQEGDVLHFRFNV
jgi:ribosome-binding ATPase YchF (GTP1/OBG family)